MIKFTALRPLRQEEWTIEQELNRKEKKMHFLSASRFLFLFYFFCFLIPSLHYGFFKCGNMIFLQSTRNFFCSLFLFSYYYYIFFLAASAIRKLSWFNLVPSELLFLFCSLLDSLTSSIHCWHKHYDRKENEKSTEHDFKALQTISYTSFIQRWLLLIPRSTINRKWSIHLSALSVHTLAHTQIGNWLGGVCSECATRVCKIWKISF